MKTTILIPNYNGIRFLEACLASIYKAEPNADVLVVDNGSTDGSVDFLRAYEQVELIALGENTGFTGAVNVGIEHLFAREKKQRPSFVYLLNNDVTVQEGFLSALEEKMEQDEKIFSVCSQMRMLYEPDYVDSAGVYYCALGWAFDYGKGKHCKEKYEKPRQVFAGCGGAVLYRMSVLAQIGLLDNAHFAYLEDVDIGYRAKLYGYKNVYEPASVVFHAGSSTSGSKYNEFKTNLSSRNSIYIIGKNMPILQILFNLPFLLLGFGVKTLFFVKKGLGKQYVKGLWKGICMCFSKEGKSMHVRFRWKHFFTYFRIQGELLLNIIRRFFL